FAVTNSVFEMEPLADLLLPASKSRHKAPTVRLRAFSHRQFQESRQDVLQAHRLFRAQTRPKPQFRRARDEERDIGRTFIRFALSKKTVIAEHFAMVRREEYHPGTFGFFAPLFELVH